MTMRRVARNAVAIALLSIAAGDSRADSPETDLCVVSFALDQVGYSHLRKAARLFNRAQKPVADGASATRP